MKDHEYSVLGGLNRARIGHAISMVAAGSSSLMVTLILSLIAFANQHGWGGRIPQVILWPVSAGVVYGALYWLFDRHMWKFPPLAKLLRVPNLSGKWHCDGQTINPDKTPGYVWNGEVTIVQSWDRLRIRLKTTESGSNSIAAALFYDEADGYRVMYNYENDPNIGALELKSHRGFADFTFNKDLQTAEGEYFNGHGRFTFGTMKLIRKA